MAYAAPISSLLLAARISNCYRSIATCCALLHCRPSDSILPLSAPAATTAHLAYAPARAARVPAMRLPQDAFPVASKTYERAIGGIATQFAFSAYADRILLIVTQTGTFGTIIEASQDSAYAAGGATFSTTVLLGKRDEPLLPLAARQIVEAAAAAGCGKPLMLCLGLRNHSAESIKAVIKAVAQENIWAAPSSGGPSGADRQRPDDL